MTNSLCRAVRRYVILHHEMPPASSRPAHWDFMLESGEALRTWALAQAPCADVAIAADALADHRLVYLTYEGPISGERGSVTQWDAGEYDILLDSDGELHCELRGRRLCGTAILARDPTATAGDQRWMFRFRNK